MTQYSINVFSEMEKTPHDSFTYLSIAVFLNRKQWKTPGLMSSTETRQNGDFSAHESHVMEAS